MPSIGALLSAEVDRLVATIIRRGLIRRRSVLGSEAFQTGRSLDERAIHGEVLDREQAEGVSLPDHFIEEVLSYYVLQESLRRCWVLRSAEGVPFC